MYLGTVHHQQLPFTVSEALEVDTSTPEAREFIMRNFYVDDGLASFPSEAEAVYVLRSSQETVSNICLHKIAANSSNIMQALPPED